MLPLSLVLDFENWATKKHHVQKVCDIVMWRWNIELLGKIENSFVSEYFDRKKTKEESFKRYGYVL